MPLPFVSTPRPTSALGVVLVVFALCAATPAVEADAAAWTEVRTPHFRVLGELAPEQVTEIALAGERLLAVLDRLTNSAGLTSPGPLTFYVFGSHEHLTRYMPAGWDAAGFLQQHPHGVYGAFVGTDEAVRQIHRQIVLQLLATRFPTLPEWLRQGIAEINSSLKVTDDEVHAGLPLQSHLWALHHPDFKFGVADLVAADAQTAADIQSFHVKAWALVHYAVYGSPRTPSRLDRYLNALRRLERPHRAFAIAFGDSAESFEQKIKEYVDGDTFRFARIPLTDLPTVDAESRLLTPPRATARLAELQLHTNPDRIAEAVAALRRVTSVVPTDASAWTGLGEAEAIAGNHAAAIRALRRAVALDAGGFKSLLLLGEELLRSQSGTEHPRELVLEAIEVLERAVDLNAESFAAWERLAYAYALQQHTPERAVEAGRRALHFRPGRTDLVFNLLLVHARRGETDDVRTLLTRLEALGADEEQTVGAREMLLQLLLKEARVQMRADRLDDATASLSEVHARTTNESTRTIAADWLDRVRTVQQRNQFAELYNRAAVAYNNDDWGAAQAAIEQLSAIAKSGRQVETVDHLRREIEYWRE